MEPSEMLSNPTVRAQVALWVRLLRSESDVATYLLDHSEVLSSDYEELRRRLRAAADIIGRGQ